MKTSFRQRFKSYAVMEFLGYIFIQKEAQPILRCVTMSEGAMRKHTGKCFDCSGALMLFEIDMQKSTKIMICQNCGLFHYYRKDFIGNYKLTRVSKVPEVDKKK